MVKLIRALVVMAFAVIGLDCHSVTLDTSGRGQALLFPYFTAQANAAGPFNTYMSLVNHDLSSGKALRVRFREGRNSREIASFNVFIGPLDTWTGVVVPSSSGAQLVVRDQSCMSGGFQTSGGARVMEFSSNDFERARADGLGADAARRREGFIEVIEMGTLSLALNEAIGFAPGASSPRSCGAIQSVVQADVRAPVGGLSGTLTLIHVASGFDFTTRAMALGQLTSQAFYRPPNDPYPDFDAAEVTPVSTFLVDGQLVRAAWTRGVDAVASVLMTSEIGNEMVLDSATKSGTDWVVTFPLQRFGLPAIPSPATGYPPGAGAGLRTRFRWAPRDGSTNSYVTSCFTPCPPSVYEGSPRLPWASSVVSFAAGSTPQAEPISSSSVLSSSNAVRVTLLTSTESGAGNLEPEDQPRAPFDGSFIDYASGVPTTARRSLRGIPAIGFMLRTFQNGTLQCQGASCQGNYGGSFDHAFKRALE